MLFSLNIYLHQIKREKMNLLLNGYWWRFLQLKKS